jgi:hypothetical protein
MKIIRHGYECYHPDKPDKPGESNRAELRRELTDLVSVMSMLEFHGDIKTMTEEDVVEGTNEFVMARMNNWPPKHWMSDRCWSGPSIETLSNGSRVIVHRKPS